MTTGFGIIHSAKDQTLSDKRQTQSIVVQELNKGRSVREVAAHLGVSHTYVYKVARTLKLPLNKPLRIPSPKAHRIFDSITPSMPPSTVARIYRITPATMQSIITHYKAGSQ